MGIIFVKIMVAEKRLKVLGIVNVKARNTAIEGLFCSSDELTFPLILVQIFFSSEGDSSFTTFSVHLSHNAFKRVEARYFLQILHSFLA